MLSLPQRRTLPKCLLHIHIQTLQARKRILPLLNISTYNPQRAIHTRTPLVPNHPRPRRHPDDGCLSWKPMRQNNHRRKLVLLPMIHYCHATMKLDLKTHSGNTRQHTRQHTSTHTSVRRPMVGLDMATQSVPHTTPPARRHTCTTVPTLHVPTEMPVCGGRVHVSVARAWCARGRRSVRVGTRRTTYRRVAGLERHHLVQDLPLARIRRQQRREFLTIAPLSPEKPRDHGEITR